MLPRNFGSLITLNFMLFMSTTSYLANTYQKPSIINADASKNPQPGIINCTIMPTPTKKNINPISLLFLHIPHDLPDCIVCFIVCTDSKNGEKLAREY